MAMDLLGETLDVHCGGVDLIFPHHEDEIAQSEAATGKVFSPVWCHGGFLQVEGAKMAKRVGNVWNVSEVREQGISPAAIRHFVFTTHYRKELNLVPEAIEASMEGVRRIGDFADRLESVSGGTAELSAAADSLEQDVRAALFDDLNAPEALAALFTFVRRANAELDKRGDDAEAVQRARDAFGRVNAVLDIVPTRATSGETVEVGGAQVALAGWVEERLAARRAARARRDFAEADRIRGELTERGVAIEDSADGTRWKVVR
jgi:cysteinyl-tRNA synthetase